MLKKLIKNDKGQVAPVFAIMLIFLLTLFALAAETGEVYFVKNKADSIAEITALSAGGNIYDDDADIKAIASAIAVANGAKANQITTQILDPNADGNREIKVTIKLTYKPLFGKVIARGEKTIQGTSSFVSLSAP